MGPATDPTAARACFHLNLHEVMEMAMATAAAAAPPPSTAAAATAAAATALPIMQWRGVIMQFSKCWSWPPIRSRTVVSREIYLRAGPRPRPGQRPGLRLRRRRDVAAAAAAAAV